MPTTTLMNGFAAVPGDERLWAPDGALGLAEAEDGTWQLLNADGHAANGYLAIGDAAHILNRCQAEGCDAEETFSRWEQYASINAPATTCAFCGIRSREVAHIDDVEVQPYLRGRGIIGLSACPACYEEQRADAEQAAEAEE